jgi:hypothetical protein
MRGLTLRVMAIRLMDIYFLKNNKGMDCQGQM